MPTLFNQDAACLARFDARSTRIFYCDPFAQCYGASGGCARLAMLFSTSLVASVDPTRSRVTVLNTKKGTVICELSYTTAVQRVLLSRRRVAVELADKLLIYDIANMKLLHTIHLSNTCCALHGADTSLLAYQHSPGKITLFDTLTLKPIHHFSPHTTNIQTMQFSQDGTRLATCSVQGTVVKVYDLQTFELAHEFRRGSTRATITSMALNDKLLVVASSNSTVHFFSLEPRQDTREQDSRTIRGRRFLPSQLNSFLGPQRDFKTIKIPATATSNGLSVGLCHDGVFVANDDALWKYSFAGETVFEHSISLQSDVS